MGTVHVNGACKWKLGAHGPGGRFIIYCNGGNSQEWQEDWQRAESLSLCYSFKWEQGKEETL